ncbi:MAG: 50S ribosomal protein L3 N(5)-glutamine methyltransferase [Gammaproteobacteria bacterium]
MSFVTDTQDFETILDFIRYGISRARVEDLYYGHGTDNAEDDIYALIWDSLSLPWEPDPQFLHARLTPGEKKILAERLEKRIIQRVPVPYLTQKAHFCDLNFYVDDRVLIPRSPIAELIQQQFTPWIEPEQVTSILDLCTGSGCIAIACCAWFPEAKVVGSDISEQALAVAAMNIERHAVQDQMTLLKSDCFDQIPHAFYDIIVSNPPYVAQAVMQNLPIEYTHEPRMALFAEQKGLAVVQKILHQAGRYLSEQGILVVEVGESADDLIALYPDVPFVWLDFERGGEGIFLLSAQMVREFFK